MDEAELTFQETTVKYCNVTKVVNVVRAKRDNSLLAGKFLRFIGFVSLYVVLVWGQRNGYNAYSITDAMKELVVYGTFRDPASLELKNWDDIVTVEDFWNWLILYLIPRMLPTEEATNTTVADDVFQQAQNDAVRNEAYRVLMHNKLTGGIRLTQRRSQKTKCPLADKYAAFGGECYHELYLTGYVGKRSKDDFMGADGVTKYQYQEKPLSGMLDDFGYYENLPRTQEAAVAAARELWQNAWIGKATKWLRVDYDTYNSNVGMFTHIEHRATFSNTGSVGVSWAASNIESSGYSTLSSRVRMAGEIVLVIWWAAYVVDEIRIAIRLARQKHSTRAYFKYTRNWIAFLQLNLFLALFGLWLSITQAQLWDDLVVEPNSIRRSSGEPTDFVSLTTLQETYFVLTGVNVLFCVFRMIVFMRVNASLAQLTDTFMLMRTSLFQFMVTFIVVLLTFVLMAHVMFGTKLKSYATFAEGIQSGFEVLQGANEYFDLLEADSVGAPIFFYPYIFVMIFVVLNMTIAIIMDAYLLMQEDRKQAERSQMEDLITLQPLTQMYRGMIRRLEPVSFFLPTAWRNRLSGLTKDMVLELLSDIESGDEYASLDMTCVPFDDLKEMLRDREITEEMLSGVFDRYKAWGAPDTEHEDMVAKLVQENEEETEWLDVVQDVSATLEDMQQMQDQMSAKLNLVIKNFANI